MHFKVVIDTEKIVWFENEYNKNSNIAYLSGVPDKIPKKSLENFAIKTNSFKKKNFKLISCPSNCFTV